MRALMTVAGVAFAVALTGCGGTGFTASAKQQIAFRLGDVNSSCSAIGATTEVPHSDGSQTSFVHQIQGNSCVMTVQWRGPVIDMAALRSEIARDEPDAHKDMTGLTIEKFDVDLKNIQMSDVASNHVLNVPDSAFQQYDLQLNFNDGTPFVHLQFINDNFGTGTGQSSNPDHAHITLSNEAHMMNLLNANLVSGSVGGTGTATMKVSPHNLEGFTTATDPAIKFELDYDVSGGAHQ
jgi:hypothetical protein